MANTAVERRERAEKEGLFIGLGTKNCMEMTRVAKAGREMGLSTRSLAAVRAGWSKAVLAHVMRFFLGIFLVTPASALMVPVPVAERPAEVPVTVSADEVAVDARGQAFGDVLQVLQQRSGVSFVVSEELLGEKLDFGLRAKDWQSLIVDLLRGYDYATRTRQGRIVKVFVLKRGEAVEREGVFTMETIEERAMPLPAIAPEPGDEELAAVEDAVADPNKPPGLPDTTPGMTPPKLEPGEPDYEEPDSDQDPMKDYKEELAKHGSVSADPPDGAPVPVEWERQWRKELEEEMAKMQAIDEAVVLPPPPGSPEKGEGAAAPDF